MTEEIKKTGKGTKILLYGLGGLALFCCAPLSCIGLIGSNSESISQSLDEQIQDAEATRDQLKQANDARQEVTANASQASSGATIETSDTNDATLPTPESSTDNQTMTVGQEFELGKYVYKISRWKTSTGLGSQFSSTKPLNGAIFVLIEYEITNNTNETLTAMTGDLKLKDSKGREFRTSSRVESALLFLDTENQDFILSELQPGLRRTMQTGFEIPTDSVDAGELFVIIPEKGFFGVGEVTIRLN